MASSPFALHLATEKTLDEIARDGARRMLQQALEEEVEAYIRAHIQELDEQGHRLVVRNGHKPERTVLSGSGPLEVRQPRVDDRRVGPEGEHYRFTSQILPPYLRKSKNIEELIPWLYLRGLSTNAFGDALNALGFDGSGLSASSVGRMKQLWQSQWEDWSRRSLEGKRYVYVWADGIHFNLRLEEGPKLAIGDGALGFWTALAEVYPLCRTQRCWVHKTANVLDKLPKGLQPGAKKQLHEIYLAESRAEATKAFDRFVHQYQLKHPKAVECLRKDKDRLLSFYDYPAEHWGHLRTTNPIESTFAGVRLRTDKTKGCGTRSACLSMVFKLCELAQKHWVRREKEEVFSGL